MGIVEIALLALGVFVLYQVSKLIIKLLLTPLIWLFKIGVVLLAALVITRLLIGSVPF